VGTRRVRARASCEERAIALRRDRRTRLADRPCRRGAGVEPATFDVGSDGTLRRHGIAPYAQTDCFVFGGLPWVLAGHDLRYYDAGRWTEMELEASSARLRYLNGSPVLVGTARDAAPSLWRWDGIGFARTTLPRETHGVAESRDARLGLIGLRTHATCLIRPCPGSPAVDGVDLYLRSDGVWDSPITLSYTGTTRIFGTNEGIWVISDGVETDRLHGPF